MAGCTFECHRELHSPGITSATSATRFAKTEHLINTADFDGITGCYLEVVGTNNDTTTKTLQLQYWTGAAWSNVTNGTAALVNGDSSKRVRGSSFSLISGATEYSVQLPATTSAGQLICYSIRIIIVQVDATKTELQFSLATHTYNGGSATDAYNSSPIDSTAGTTATQGTADKYDIWRKDVSEYADISSASDAWTLECALAGSAANRVSNCGLYQQGTTTLVGSVVSVTGSTVDVVRRTWATGATNFSDTTNFEAKIYESGTAGTAYLHKAYLCVKLVNLTKATILRRLGGYIVSGTTLVNDPYRRFLYTAANWASATWYGQYTGYDATNENADGFDSRTTTDSGGTSTQVDAGNWTSGTKSRKRNAGTVSMTDTYRYCTSKLATTGAAVCTSTALVIVVTGTAASSGLPGYDPLGMSGFFGV